MTINAITPYLVVDLTGVETTIPFDFSVALTNELAVFRDGTLLTNTVDYNFNGPAAEDEGEVLLIPPVVAGRYALVRTTDRDQLLGLGQTTNFPSAIIEQTFDKLVRRDQEQQSELDRTIMQDLFDSARIDARGLRIGNVGDPVDDQDAVTKSHLDSTYQTLPPGPPGPAGPAIPGPPGQSGPAGAPLEILTGIVAPPVNIGAENQLYLNVTNGDLYQRQLGSWVLLINLMGPPGSGGGGGVTDHGALTGLTDPDHPISAVQGLQAALDSLTALVSSTFADAPAIFRQDDPPTGSISTGSLWFDTDLGNRLFVWDGAAWVDVHDAAMDANAATLADALNDIATAQATADGKIVTFVSSTEPTATGVGDLWLRSSDNRLHRWDGSTWVDFQDNDIVDALNTAASAQATADGKIVSYYQPTPPPIVNAGLGDLWFDTDDDFHMYRFNGSTWVSVRDQQILQVAADLSGALSDIATIQATVDGVVNIFYEADAPTVGTHPTLAIGDLWVDSDDNQTYRWNGTQWDSIQDDSIAQAVTDSTNAIAIADQKIRAFYQNTAPDPGSVEVDTGDLWFDLDDNNRPYRYNGSAWVDIHALDDVIAGQLGPGGIQNNAVSEAVIGTYVPSIALVDNTWVEVDRIDVTTGDTDIVEVKARLDVIFSAQAQAQVRIRRFDDLDAPVLILGSADTRILRSGDSFTWSNHYFWRVEVPTSGVWSYRLEVYKPSAAGVGSAADAQMTATRFKK